MKSSTVVLPILFMLEIASRCLYGQTGSRIQRIDAMPGIGDYRSVLSGNWSSNLTWERFNGNNWVHPALSPDSSAGVVTIRSGHSVTINATVVYDQVVVDEGGEVIVAPGVVHTLTDGPGNDLTINGTWLNGGGTWTITGSARWIVNDGGSFIQNTTSGIATPLSKATLSKASNFIYRGSASLMPASTFSGRTYGNLSFESSGGSWTCTASGSSSLNVNGNLSINAGVKWNTGAFSGSLIVLGATIIAGEWTGSGSGNLGTHTFGAGFAVTNGGKYTLSTSGANQRSIVFRGSLSNDGILLTPSNRAIVFNGDSEQTINGTVGITFNNGFSANQTLTIAKEMIVQLGASKSLTANSDVVVFGTVSGSDANSSLVLAGSGSRLVLDEGTLLIAKLVVSDGYLHTIAGSGTLDGCTVRIDSGSSVVVTAGLTLISGGVNLTNGSITMDSTSTLRYSGTSSQMVVPLTYWNLVVNNNAGVVLGGPTCVNGIVDVRAGALSTGPYSLTLGPFSVLNEVGLATVIGTIATTRALTSGINETFGNLGVELRGSFLRPTSATVTRVTGTAPRIPGATAVSRFYDIRTADTSFSSTLVFHYSINELNGSNESNLQLFRSTDDGASWLSQGGVVNTSAHTLTLTGITAFSRWTAAEKAPAPSLTSISPRSGAVNETVIVSLTGNGFSNAATSIAFSGTGIKVNSLTMNSSTLMTASITIALDAPRGFRDVSVTTPSGSGILRGAFEVTGMPNPVPILTSIFPTSGARSEDLKITLHGSGFVSGLTMASFGDGVSVSDVIANATSLVVRITIASGAAPGPRDVTVTTPGPGGGSSTLHEGFSILNPVPTLANVSPTSGVRGQSYIIVLTGNEFIGGVPSVNLGNGVDVDSIVVLSNTQLRARISISSFASSGARDISLTIGEPGGGTATLIDGYRVMCPLPRIAAVVPSTGMRGEAVSVTIEGTDFLFGRSIVNLGVGVDVDSVRVINPTQIAARLVIRREASAGPRCVTVVNPGPDGGSSSLPNAFEVRNPVPAIIAVSPDSAVLGQILDVVLAGTGFLEGVSSVDLGPGVAIKSSSIDSSGTHLRLNISLAMDATTGIRDVTVSNVGPGGGLNTLPHSLIVGNPVPSLSEVTPAGCGRGRTLDVILRGANFLKGISRVTFGVGILVNSAVPIGADQIRASIAVDPNAVTGARSIEVTNPAPGGGTAKLPHVFNVENLAPMLAGVSPANGSRGERLWLTINGANFFPGETNVTFGSEIELDSIIIASAQQIRACVFIRGNASYGVHTIVVTNPLPGGGSASLADAFTVTSDIVTAADRQPGVVPRNYFLEAAYPNPFNPSTKMRFGLPEESSVELNVYDLLGHVVAKLERGARLRGVYEVEWIARAEPTGVYLVRLSSESLESHKRYVAVRKVVLAK